MAWLSGRPRRAAAAVVATIILGIWFFVLNMTAYLHRSNHYPSLLDDNRHLKIDSNKPGYKIGRISILYGNNSINKVYERALAIHQRHGERHGYDMQVQRESMLEGYWTKPAFMEYIVLSELRKPPMERLDWLFWFDVDTVILNHNIMLEDLLPPKTDNTLAGIQLVISDDINGLNNGVFGVRVSPWAAKLFAGILAMRELKPDTLLLMQDQSAMDHVLNLRQYVNRIAKLPQRWINAYEATDHQSLLPYHMQPGDFVLHFAGVLDREFRMRRWCDVAEQMSPIYNIPLNQTEIGRNRDQFWAAMKAKHEARISRWQQGKKNLEAALQQANMTLSAAWTNGVANSAGGITSKLEEAYQSAKQFLAGVETLDDLSVIEEDQAKCESIFATLNKANEAAQQNNSGAF